MLGKSIVDVHRLDSFQSEGRMLWRHLCLTSVWRTITIERFPAIDEDESVDQSRFDKRVLVLSGWSLKFYCSACISPGPLDIKMRVPIILRS